MKCQITCHTHTALTSRIRPGTDKQIDIMLSREDRILIKGLRDAKGYGAKNNS